MKFKFFFFGSLLLFLLWGCSFETQSEVGERIDVELVSVIDGDTIRIIMEGQEETVRYLLIDTPETNHPQSGQQPLGPEATAENKRLLESGNVSVELDAGDRYDQYGRLLAYVYADEKSVQEHLLESGLARVAYVFPPNTSRLDEFQKAEQFAKDRELGIWEFEGYVHDRGFDEDKYGIPSSTQNNGECKIKGNINRNGDKIYHMPHQHSYAQTNPEKWFCSEEEARSAGFRSTGN
jgi:micrococcal nuclease